MGEEVNKSIIDATVGALLWVRRRNGSWWPGQILGPEELPEGCVPTPRAGTPVKLLGRDDASVDWYNLEKSKRVKAFHCGEYDDCIKKVKNSMSLLSKKAAKYAKREDAILHALELEQARLGQQNPDSSSSPFPQNESPFSEDVDVYLNSSAEDSDSAPEESRTPNDSEDDGCEGAKRMRGLEDIGIGATLSFKKKRKNRHLPLTKVMASSTKINDSVVIGDNSDRNENGTLLNACSDASTKCQSGDNENGSSQKLFDVPLVAEEHHSAGFSSSLSEIGGRAHSTQSSRVEAVSSTNDELNKPDPTIPSTTNIEKTTCEWRFKGKRNSRPRKLDRGEAHTPQRLLPYRHSRSTINPKYDDSNLSLNLKPHTTIPTLYDVKIEVETGFRPRHVPYISLMSKLTGRPIIGHPLTTEVFDDGFLECEPRKPRGRPKMKSRRNAILSKKTRKLSLLSREETKAVVEKMKGPSIACVPLKIVFSRISAALSSSVRNVVV